MPVSTPPAPPARPTPPAPPARPTPPAPPARPPPRRARPSGEAGGALRDPGGRAGGAGPKRTLWKVRG
eukprot:416132-Prorocentrum_minimum.AAC.6